MEKTAYFKYLNEKHNTLEELKEYARINHVPIMLDEGITLLKQIIKISGSKKILEIGTAIGYSAINFALVDHNIHVTTIERDQKMYDLAMENIAKYHLEDRIKVIFNDALLLDDDILDSEYDLIFVDAAKGQYQKFFIKYTALLRKGGIIFTDNLIFHDLIFAIEIENRNTKQLVNKIRVFNEWLKNNDEFETVFYNIGDGIAISIKK